MPAKTVRLLADDVALVHRWSTLDDNPSFAVKAHAVLRDSLREAGRSPSPPPHDPGRTRLHLGGTLMLPLSDRLLLQLSSGRGTARQLARAVACAGGAHPGVRGSDTTLDRNRSVGTSTGRTSGNRFKNWTRTGLNRKGTCGTRH
jgi:hypothetical protein